MLLPSRTTTPGGTTSIQHRSYGTQLASPSGTLLCRKCGRPGACTAPNKKQLLVRAVSKSGSSCNSALPRAAATSMLAATLLLAQPDVSSAATSANLLRTQNSITPATQIVSATYGSGLLSPASMQPTPVSAPSLTLSLIPVTPFQTPNPPGPTPAATDSKQSCSSPSDNCHCDTNSSCNCSTASCSCSCSSSTDRESPSSTTQQQRSTAVSPLDPLTPPNSPPTPPPPHTPLPTPNQPHFPLLPTPPPPALPPQLLPPSPGDQPPPQRLLPKAAPDGLQQQHIQPVEHSDISSSSSRDKIISSSAGVWGGENVYDSPISLLKLSQVDQLLQEQWQQALLATAVRDGASSSVTMQEPSALLMPGDTPVPSVDQNMTAYNLIDTFMNHADGLVDTNGVCGSAGNSSSSVGMHVAAATADLRSKALVRVSYASAEGDGGQENAVLDRPYISSLGSAQQQQQQLGGPQLADDVPILQVLEAVPSTAHCPEAAAAAPADCSSVTNSSNSTTAGRFAASAAAATTLDSSSSSSSSSGASQGTTGTPVTPFSGGGASSSSSSGSVKQQAADTLPKSQSAKAAKGIQEGIESARSQLAARSKALEYQSPGYERLIDASKRLLVALIALAQFVIKVVLGVAVWVVKGLVQILQLFLNR